MMSAIIQAVHGMAAVAWVGGIFFAYMALRPAANATLEPPQRVRLRALSKTEQGGRQR